MPFHYPEMAHARRHGPSGYDTYKTYKDWLRDEFVFRCVYCLERERWYPSGAAAFAVDHVRPKGVPEFAHLVCDYENLVYACNRCNSAKGEDLLLDPCSVAYCQHLRVTEDGAVEGLTTEGKELVDILGLDLQDAIDERQKAFRIIALAERYPNDPDVRLLYVQYFGFPAELPDLAGMRPGGNTRPDGVKRCYHRLRTEGLLPEVY